MIFSILTGGVLGASGIPIPVALPIMILLILCKGFMDIYFNKNPILGTPSPYVTYIEKLFKSGGLTQHPSQDYLLHMAGIGTMLGSLSYAAGIIIF